MSFNNTSPEHYLYNNLALEADHVYHESWYETPVRDTNDQMQTSSYSNWNEWKFNSTWSCASFQAPPNSADSSGYGSGSLSSSCSVSPPERLLYPNQIYTTEMYQVCL
jgi:hypothetical protein